MKAFRVCGARIGIPAADPLSTPDTRETTVMTRPEFQANVVAVLTGEYWDMEVVELRARDAKIKQKLRELQEGGKLSREDKQYDTDTGNAKEVLQHANLRP
jgi:hypothetical protein